MSAIGPGDWVEYIGGANRHKSHKPSSFTGWPVVGNIYQVREIVPGCWADGSLEDGVRLVGIVAYRRKREGAWGISCFRPIYRPKSDLIKQLNQPAPNVVRELIAAD